MQANPKSIVICCNSFPPEKGGAPTRIYNMALLLRQAGYEVTVITAMPNYPTGSIFPGYGGRLVHREMVDGIRVIRLWLVPSNSGRILARGLSVLTYLAAVFFLSGPRLVFGRADLVIVSSPPLLSAWLSAFLARCGRKKVLVNISDIWPLTAAEMGVLKKGFMFRLLQWMERSLYKMATAFTGQSEEILEHIQTSAQKPKKTHFLYRNLQDEKLVADATIGQPIRILYAGNLGHAQGMLELCRAIDFKALCAELHIYGDGGERGQLEAFLVAGSDRGIYLHNTIPQKELDAHIGDYDALLIPLKVPIYGAVPSKLFMAVAAGIPVLFIAGGEGAQLVHKYQLGRVNEPGDYAGLQRSILAMVQMSLTEQLTARKNIRVAQETAFSKPQQDTAFRHFLDELMH